jgi:galactokinase
MSRIAMDSGATVRQAFLERFGGLPDVVVRAPGRVNLIGEHTDYNDGFVLPMAIDRAVWIALRATSDGHVRVHGVDVEEEGEFSLSAVSDAGPPAPGTVSQGWLEYLKGTAWALMDAGHELSGWEGTVAGDVPMAAGLSSSAALELATACAFAQVGDLPWDPVAMALLGQRAENRWVGVNCGIMDQMISACGRADHALLLDCRTLVGQHVPLPQDTSVIILDTNTRRGLVDSAYNERRSQCESVSAHFGVEALRDVTSAELARRAGELDDLALRRARHVITENERTVEAADVLATGNARHMGELMNASHTSLRDDFEVSSEALDVIVECARQSAGCHGARMTGAGFGGCAVALAETAAAAELARSATAKYRKVTGHTPQAYVCTATDGAGSAPSGRLT